LMNGSQISFVAGVGCAPVVWAVAETGDFNRDGKSDILWRDTTGDVGVWFMNGSQVSSANGIATASPVWSVQGASAD